MNIGRSRCTTTFMPRAMPVPAWASLGPMSVGWQIRFESSTVSGVPNRVVTWLAKRCHPRSVQQLIQPALQPSTDYRRLAGIPSEPPGAATRGGDVFRSYIDATRPAFSLCCSKQSDRYRQIDLRRYRTDRWKSSVPGVLAYEFDRQFTNYNTPLSNTDPASEDHRGARHLHAAVTFLPTPMPMAIRTIRIPSLYQVTSGYLRVFAAGSMYWNWGLDSYTPPSGIVSDARCRGARPA